jgi:hypothetical protein
VWQSSIKVVNVNSYQLTVFPEVVNFEAVGEAGQGKFTPILHGDGEKSTLANWIHVDTGPKMIEPEQTGEITFFVEVPKDAPPGGHYAAILVTTEPPNTNGEKLAVRTSQAVTSLLFMRVEGDVHELATIREFRTTHSFLEKPEAEFALRFENKGNVHLQPRGYILITNMWGTERGRIPINYQTHFGNVLPKSIRDFTFTWQSDFSLSDIGRYKAVATLAYGQTGSQSATATTYFWVIPLKGTLITLAVLICFITLITMMVKAYIRRMLALAGVDVSGTKKQTQMHSEEDIVPETKVRPRLKKVTAPLRSGVLDLRERLSTVEESVSIIQTIFRFVMHYKVFFISLMILIGIFVTAVLYIGRVTDEDRAYKVTTVDENGTKTILDTSAQKE